MRIRPLTLVAAFAALAACADEADIADTGAAAGAAVTPADQTSDVAEIAEYELRMEQVDKYFAASRNIGAAVQRMTPEQRQQLDMDAGQTDLNGYIARLEGTPAIDQAIREAGLTAREYSLILWSMLQSGMASAVLQSRPNANEDSLARAMQVDMDNVRFMREHEAELRQKQQALEADLEAMGMGRDST